MTKYVSVVPLLLFIILFVERKPLGVMLTMDDAMRRVRPRSSIRVQYKRSRMFISADTKMLYVTLYRVYNVSSYTL